MKRKNSRETFSLHTILHLLILLAGNTLSGPILGSTVFICLPATITGCSVPEADMTGTTSRTTMRIMENSSTQSCGLTTLDILIFNDDQLQRLDTYQQLKPASCATVKAASGSGEKIFSLIANSRRERRDWAFINSREALLEEYSMIEEERRGNLTMSGEWKGKAGSSSNVTISRICSEIVLRSICCDMKDGSRMTNARVYLTNVCAEAPLIPNGKDIPRRIINAGRLNVDETASLAEPDMLLQEIPSEIGRQRIYPDIRLLCYPNEVETEGAGSPFTRLVIEGELDGRKYYWPLNINRNNGGNGIERNKQYIYDITIRKPGHDDPDIPIEPMDMEIKTEVKEWEEREEYGVRF